MRTCGRRRLLAALALTLAAPAWATEFGPLFKRSPNPGSAIELACTPPAVLAQDVGDTVVGCKATLPADTVDGTSVQDGSLSSADVDATICKADGSDCPADADTWCGSGQTCLPSAVGLGALAAGEVWLGPSYTPADVLTQAEFDGVGPGDIYQGDLSGNAMPYSMPAGRDIRTWGAVCDGATDDSAAFNTAFDDLTAVGGAILVPAGKTCAIASDVQMESKVSVVCARGGGFKATGASYTAGLFVGTSKTLVRIVGCTFDMNGKATSAMKVASGGESSHFRGNKITGAATAGTFKLVDISDTLGIQLVDDNDIACSGSGTPTETGISVSVIIGTIYVRDNSVINCDTVGIESGGVVKDNAVSGSAIGIKADADGARVVTNVVSASLATSIGIDVEADSVQVIANHVAVSGASAIGFDLRGRGNITHSGNYWDLTGASATGIALSGNHNNITGCYGDVSNATEGTDRYHIKVGSAGANNTSMITSCVFMRGQYAIAPTQTGTEYDALINIVINDNTMFAQYVTAVVMGTGWTLTGNRIAWGNAAMSALVWYGDNRTYGAIANHGTISGNFFHTSGAPRCLAFADRGMHCDTSSGANVRKFCTVATEVADCGGATRCVADSGYTGNVAITGNTFFNCVSSTGDFIDMDGAGLTSESAAIGSVTISGNQFTDSASTQTLITFDPALPSKYGNITIGGNGWTRTAGAYVENWDTAMGVWHDLPRMMCVAVDNVSSSTLRPFWAAPDTGAEVWALKCNHFDTCGTVPHVRLEDQSANQIGSGGSLVCDSGTSATWLAFTSARQVQAREVVYLKVTNSPTATCDVLVCAQYDG